MILNVLVWSTPKFHFVFTKACEHRGFDSNSPNRWTNDENNYLAFVKTLVLFVCLLLVNKVELLDFEFKHSNPDKTRKVVKLNTREFKFYQQIYIRVSISMIKYIRSCKLYLLHYDCNYLCNFFLWFKIKHSGIVLCF